MADQSPESNRSWPSINLARAYVVCGLVVGMVAGATAIPVGDYCVYQLELHPLYDIDTGSRPRPIPDLLEDVFGGAMLGGMLGLGGAGILIVAGARWRRARHPPCAASVCASPIASITLLFCAAATFPFPFGVGMQEHPLARIAIVVACAAVAGATYGFLTTVLARNLSARLTTPSDRV